RVANATHFTIGISERMADLGEDPASEHLYSIGTGAPASSRVVGARDQLRRPGTLELDDAGNARRLPEAPCHGTEESLGDLPNGGIRHRERFRDGARCRFAGNRVNGANRSSVFPLDF